MLGLTQKPSACVSNFFDLRGIILGIGNNTTSVALYFQPWLQTVPKRSQYYLDRVVKNVYILKMSSGRSSMSFQSMPESEDKGKIISWLHKNLPSPPKKRKKKRRNVLSSDKVLGLKVKEQHQPGAKQRLKGQLCISEGCKMISYNLLLTYLFRK